jgi:hypothetical protein
MLKNDFISNNSRNTSRGGAPKRSSLPTSVLPTFLPQERTWPATGQDVLHLLLLMFVLCCTAVGLLILARLIDAAFAALGITGA